VKDSMGCEGGSESKVAKGHIAGSRYRPIQNYP
jgi:hypothetical protein